MAYSGFEEIDVVENVVGVKLIGASRGREVSFEESENKRIPETGGVRLPYRVAGFVYRRKPHQSASYRRVRLMKLLV